ncbi:FHA domain-containing protein [Paenibacillus barengoltzii]|uniref:Response regulators consisting of a CheY-like receiver domain and a winged-helix DNA-binding domain n=1 Tax=Paenibacillus barengoltzii J12 TaxID=935846 RepID=A0ABY1LYA2_9BACL|nr:FHA domain-containing protein [Paenibacillus barengoltzii]SMF28164.1 Response regulators consisting of a CheY-like receiver domain and a winged-helix DNA-binding domain [Paenibacillus barengoltzii J12]
MDTFACIYILRGDPFRPGTCIYLDQETTEIGRTSSESFPDMAFTNIFISRKHLMIRKEGDRAVAYDLGSRHGTELNGVRMIPHAPYVLETNDILKLARGTCVLHFSYSPGEQTLEFEPVHESTHSETTEGAVTIHWEKRECIVNGVKISMSEKEYLLLQLLHEHANRLVTIREIKQTVWYDRNPGPDGLPDVTIDELTTLIYRIRKKYGRDTFQINAIRGSGYILETE